MKVALAYGRGHLEIEVPDHAVVLEPKEQIPLPDERAALRVALDEPIASDALAASISPDARICIVHTDLTRATPNDRLIPWLLEYLHEAGARRENITLLNATGTHRPNTRAELEQMLTAEVVSSYRCLNHHCEDEAACVQFGVTRTGAPALINRHVAEADVRIITGFIEPHFFAGFSGGPKGIMPGASGRASSSTSRSTTGDGSPHSSQAT
jgi:nickel-dependent lactate racemase